ncbi:MAG TPA: hypothetical protein PLL36_10385, partial [Candidatus Hydrogenedentes bacterium]|nr:hypothetical protein [Candidatus Hydrogenedentota bacterium]
HFESSIQHFPANDKHKRFYIADFTALFVVRLRSPTIFCRSGQWTPRYRAVRDYPGYRNEHTAMGP